MGEKVKADDIAAVFREEIRADVNALKAQGVNPTFVAFLGTGDVAAKKYSEWTMKACESDGIKFEVREVGSLYPSR
jgi:methylenetetrahydrofolate dehydrogenase (NAD+)